MASSGTNDDYTLLGKTHEFLSTGAANKSDGTTTWGTISDNRVKNITGTYTKGLTEIS